ncbi:neprosin family prolyl endopeptidase [Actinoplanes sp. NPDC049599]|uniref:neprosin family prolyl endopeptidase n=1 Tax=Actinoplanes sp. NPDC049599 TaxID=3363903 RepID=UPI0037BA21A0
MGTVWTLNASAEETPEAEAPAAVVAPADTAVETAITEAAPVAPAAVSVPPRLLPWGSRPVKLKRARAGASSAAVAAAGADAAPADKSGSMKPKPEYAPKGGQGPNGKFLKSMRTNVVPPMPPSVGTADVTAAAADRPVNFHYAVGTQLGESDGTWANLTVEKPRLVEGDYHTLAELAVRSADTQHTVEVGWTVDRSVNGDDDPHLFVYYWKDGKRTCYNACGFTQYSKTVKPGDTLPVGTQKRFGIQHAGSAWWIAYDSEWIGYFHDSNWEGRYTKVGVTQWFGEVASPSLTPCTQMGNGKLSTSGSAARIGSISMTNGPVVKFDLDQSPDYLVDVENPLPPVPPTKPEDPTWTPWTGELLSATTFRYGGPVYPLKDPKDENSGPIVTC